MSQIVLPLPNAAGTRPSRILVGQDNAHVVESFAQCAAWPFRTAVLVGPPRSGKSQLAQWFTASGAGTAIDDADRLDETELFHHWNRAQENDLALLLVAKPGWNITLPDLASRVGAALHLEIAAPDDKVLTELLILHAELRGFTLGPDAAAYLLPRCNRSHQGIEHLVSTIDRISLERKAAPTMAIWRDALEDISGASQPRLL